MSFPTTDPKFNEAFFRWTTASQTRYLMNNFSADTVGEILQHVHVDEMRALCTLLGIKRSGTKTQLILRLQEAFTGIGKADFGHKVCIKIVPCVTD